MDARAGKPGARGDNRDERRVCVSVPTRLVSARRVVPRRLASILGPRMRHAVRLSPLLLALALPACAASTPKPAHDAKATRSSAAVDSRASDAASRDLRAIDEQLRTAASPDERAALLTRRAEACRARKGALGVQLYALGEVLTDAPESERASIDARMRVLEDEARAMLDQAIDAYTKRVDEPALAGAPGGERALETLARLLREKNDRAAASHRYEQLVSRYPEGTHTADALLALAEIALSDDRLDDTVAYADRAVAARPSDADLVSSARYLKAWSLRGLSERGRAGAMLEAMTALRDVVALGPSTRRGARFLAPTAERELVELYASYGDPKSASSFFGQLEHDAAERLLGALRARLARGSAPVQTSL